MRAKACEEQMNDDLICVTLRGQGSSCTIRSCMGRNHRGCRFQPTQTILQNDAQSPQSDVKALISLSDVSGNAKALQFPPKRREITSLCQSPGYWVHDKTAFHRRPDSNDHIDWEQVNQLKVFLFKGEQGM